MRRLGVDPGAKRVGLSWCDHDVSIALPLKTLSVSQPAQVAAALRDEIEALGVEEVVVGLPLQMDGRESEGAKRSRALAAQIEQATNVRVNLWDERMTTLAAQRSLRDAGIGARDQKDKVDQAAATLLLQSYLDSLSEARWDAEPMHHDAPTPRAGSGRRRSSSRGR